MNIKMIASWIVAVLLALAFLGSGVTKLMSMPMMVAQFALFGYPTWFLYVTGIIELAAAVLVLIPRFAGLGATLIICVMVGAVLSHVTHGQAGYVGAPIILLLLAVLLGWLRGWSGVGRAKVAVAA